LQYAALGFALVSRLRAGCYLGDVSHTHNGFPATPDGADTEPAMSRENVELVQRVVEHFNATGQLGPGFDAVIHPQVEFEDEIGAYNSRSEVRAFLEGFAQAIGGLHVGVREVRDLGETIMLVVVQSGLGTSSGVPVEQPFTWVMAFEGNRCVRWRIYADHTKALEAAGLEE
jgi:ketosteroid isomerase-like protein